MRKKIFTEESLFGREENVSRSKAERSEELLAEKKGGKKFKFAESQ